MISFRRFRKLHIRKVALPSMISYSLAFMSCQENASPSTELSQQDSIHEQSFSEAVHQNQSSSKVIPDSLSLVNYLKWIKVQKGVTFNFAENSSFYIEIKYKPLPVEAALSLNEKNLSQEALKEMKEKKKDYLYFELSYLEKVPSVNKSANHQQLLQEIIRKSIFIETGSGTVFEPIIEFFSPVMLNQPGKALILIPAGSFEKWIRVKAGGERYSLPETQLYISESSFKELPKIKV